MTRGRDLDAARLKALLSGLVSGQGELPEVPAEWLIRHRLDALAYHEAQRRGMRLPPGWDPLRDRYYQTLAQSALQWDGFLRVLRLLHEHGIEAVLLKGAALNATVYRRLGLRSMGDVDLWLPRGRMRVAEELLLGEEYAHARKDERPLPLQEHILGEMELVPLRPGLCALDLHWLPFQGLWVRYVVRYDPDEMWERTVPVDLEGVSARVLSPEDMVIHLCTHFAVNHQCGDPWARTLVDLALFLRHHPLDWDRLAARVESMNLRTVVGRVLEWVYQVIDLGPFPCPSLRLSEPRRRWLDAVQSLEDVLAAHDLRHSHRRYLLLVGLVDRPSGLLRVLGRALWPERDWLAARYSVRTPIELGVARGRHLWRLLTSPRF